MAQSVIGALRVNLGLDSAQFESGARRVRNPLNEMRRQFAVVAAAAAAFGAAISAAARRGAEDIDRTAKAARRLDASVTGFRALELVADEAGVSVESLANDIQSLNREIANIGTSGNALRALNRLGIAASDLAGLDADEKLARIADRVKELGLSAGQATAVLRDLGIRNREMALLVLQGGDALRRGRKDIEEYGLALSDVDASKIEQANDQIGRLGLVGRYAAQQIALQLTPALGQMAQAITDSLREGGALRAVIDALTSNIQRMASILAVAVAGFGVRFVAALVAAKLATMTLSGALLFLRGAMIRTGIGVLIVGAGELVYQFTRLVQATGGWGNALSLLGNVAKGVWEGIKTSATSIVPALNAVWNDVQAGFFIVMENMTARWRDFLTDLAGAAADIPGGDALSASLFGAASRADAGVTGFMRAANDAEAQAARNREEASQRLTQGFDEARAAAAKLREAVSGASEETDGASEAAKRLNDAFGELDPDGDGGGKGGKALSQTSDLLAEIAKRVTEMEEATKRAAEQMRDAFADTFASIVTGADSAREAVGKLLQSFATMLARSAGQTIFGALGKGIGIPGFATGTPYASGGLAMVGERGPELINLPRGSRVFNASETERMSRGGVNVVNNWTINAQGAVQGVEALVRREITGLLPEVQRVSVAAVQGARSRGRL
jgi:hypothetical protein